MQVRFAAALLFILFGFCASQGLPFTPKPLFRSAYGELWYLQVDKVINVTEIVSGKIFVDATNQRVATRFGLSYCMFLHFCDTNCIF
jgi:hypothetical protein